MSGTRNDCTLTRKKMRSISCRENDSFPNLVDFGCEKLSHLMKEVDEKKCSTRRFLVRTDLDFCRICYMRPTNEHSCNKTIAFLN